MGTIFDEIKIKNPQEKIDITAEIEIKDISEFETKDRFFDEITKVYMKAYEGMEEYGEPTEKHARKYIRWLINHSDFFKILYDKKTGIIGFIACSSEWWWNGRTGEIHEICITPEFQKIGLGKLLIMQAIEYFKIRGVNKVGLWVGASNEKAIRFYKSLGFHFTGESFPRWMRMEKEISGAPGGT
jgi:ribosomal protein S18 acetylase RimI-like enzyme